MARGEPLPPDYKRRLAYRVNAFNVVVVFMVLYWGAAYLGYVNPALIAENVGGLFVVGTVFAAVQTGLHYYFGLKRDDAKFHGSLIKDLWFGIDLNPRLLGVDLKVFAYRPGMLGFWMFNLSNLYRHYQIYGTVHDAMLLFQLFTTWYTLDYFWFEKCILSIFDIIEERWGFMLIWGDYVWIPFVFSINSFLAVHDTRVIPTWMMMLMAGLFITGMIVFRQANYQKYSIKQDRTALIEGRPAEFLEGRLLVSGWWGRVRKANYLGDLLIAFSFAAPVATWSTPAAFIYPAYLTILLLQRCLRDEARCGAKYGDLWTRYCQRVPYRIIPYVF